MVSLKAFLLNETLHCDILHGCGKFSYILIDVGEESELSANEHSSLSLSR